MNRIKTVIAILFLAAAVGCQDYIPNELPQTPDTCDVCDLVGRQYVSPQPVDFVHPNALYPNVTPSECAANPVKCDLWSTDFTPVLEIYQGAYRDNFDGQDCDTGGDGTDDANWGGVLTFWGELCWGGPSYPQGTCRSRSSINYLLYSDLEVASGVFAVHGWLLDDNNSMLLQAAAGAECDTRIPQSGWTSDCNTPWNTDWIEYSAEFPIVGTVQTRLEYDGIPTEYSGDLSTVLGWSDTCGGGAKSSDGEVPDTAQLVAEEVPDWATVDGSFDGCDPSLPTGTLDTRGYVRWDYIDSARTRATRSIFGNAYTRAEFMRFNRELPATTGSGFPQMQLDIVDGIVEGTVNWTGTLHQGTVAYEDFAFSVVGTAAIRNPAALPWNWVIDIVLESPIRTGDPSIDNLQINVTAFSATRKVFISKAPTGGAYNPGDPGLVYTPVEMVRNSIPIRMVNCTWK
jgi:hypothetical protein